MTQSLRRPGLSKSRITAFEQCPKRLWLSVHSRELAQQDEGAQARFAAGHEVGALACALLPTGVMVHADPDLKAALTFTRDLLRESPNQPIFEATFEHDGVLVRVDVIEPDGKGAWHIAEVKSSTKVKDYQLGDLATQVWVARNSGLAVCSAAIRHIDTSFVLTREGDYRGLFSDTECLSAIEPAIAARAEVIAAARITLEGPEPTVAIGDHCSSPFACEFAAYCHSLVPPGPEWPVTVLPNGGGKKWLAAGVDDLLALKVEELGNTLHHRVYLATSSGQPYHDVESARRAMAGWAYPRTWLDFETISFAIPRWIGTRPYQQVPFQFSAHIEESDGAIEHREFLSLDGQDPRRSCAEALLSTLPAAGAVIAYNASFERSRLLELAAAFPQLSPGLVGIADRIVDLLPVARNCWYHRDQRGSWSIKAVLPTVADDAGHASLEVKNGSEAQQAYLEAIADSTCWERRASLDRSLRAYCAKDTEAMMVLARFLAGH